MKNIFILLFVFTLSTLHLQSQDFEYDAADYGKGISVGLSLFGDGLVGMTFKYSKDGLNQWEINPSYTASGETYIDKAGETVIELNHGIALTAGYHKFLGSRYKERKDKVIKNYIGLKGSVGYVLETNLGLGLVWHREAFRSDEKNYSRGLDLGLQFIRPIKSVDNSYVTLYLKVDWNWFR